MALCGNWKRRASPLLGLWGLWLAGPRICPPGDSLLSRSRNIWGGPYGAPYSPQEEVRFLKDQAEMLRGEIDAIDARLKELEKEKTRGGET